MWLIWTCLPVNLCLQLHLLRCFVICVKQLTSSHHIMTFLTGSTDFQLTQLLIEPWLTLVQINVIQVSVKRLASLNNFRLCSVALSVIILCELSYCMAGYPKSGCRSQIDGMHIFLWCMGQASHRVSCFVATTELCRGGCAVHRAKSAKVWSVPVITAW